jgi:alpha-beta hydrolase superfamily lysophospholipase
MQKRSLMFKNRDDKRIQAELRTPEGAAKGTIVLSHGLGGWKEQPLLVMIAEELCQKGYVVFTYDAADGAKAPDGDFTNATTTDFLGDLEEVITYVTNADWFVGPLILAGHSMGGLVSLSFARKHPARVSKLMLIAPAVSWKEGVLVSFPLGLWWLSANKNKAYGPDHRRIPLDRKWLIDFMRFDMKRDAPYVSVPTLIVSASKDGTIASTKAHQSLAHRFPKATLVVIPGAKHVFWKYEHKVADTMVKWLTSS